MRLDTLGAFIEPEEALAPDRDLSEEAHAFRARPLQARRDVCDWVCGKDEVTSEFQSLESPSALLDQPLTGPSWSKCPHCLTKMDTMDILSG